MMTAMAVVFVLVAIWLLGPPRQASRLIRIDSPTAPSIRWARVAAPLGAASMVLATAAFLIPHQFTWACMGCAVIGTSVWVVRTHINEKKASANAADVAQACRVIAAQLHIGQTPGQALAVAAEECRVLSNSLSAQEIGADVADTLERLGTIPGCSGLSSFGRAWRLCERSGGSLALPAQRVAEAVEADARLNADISAELAVPRATGRLLACLPLLGIGMGSLAGGNPLHFLTASWLGSVCLLAAVTLACAGLVWTEILAVRARDNR